MAYKPKTATYDNEWTRDLGYLPVEFEAFEPNPNYSFTGRKKVYTWKLVKPKTVPPPKDLPPVIKRMMNSTWKFAEPLGGAQRRFGGVIGSRAGLSPAFAPSPAYSPQTRLTDPSQNPTLHKNNDAIASDWDFHEQIKLRNGVTFRGDCRAPVEVISKCGGFHPPITRTDPAYLKNLHREFNDYLGRRFKRSIALEDWMQVVNKTLTTDEDRKMFIDYMTWKKLTDREAAHLGRMVENETGKGYISTSWNIDIAINFACDKGKRDGWLYVTMVKGGLKVPYHCVNVTQTWQTREAELAQYGSIPGERIVGFVRIKKDWKPEGPIFIRRSFRKKEPEAFEKMFNYMSGMIP
jgi:hypothetical protein